MLTATLAEAYCTNFSATTPRGVTGRCPAYRFHATLQAPRGVADNARARLRTGEVQKGKSPVESLLEGCREEVCQAVRWNILQQVAEADHAWPARACELEPESGRGGPRRAGVQ